MDPYRISVFAHLFFAIVLVGLALFWFIMLVALRQKFDETETARLLQVANGARWPHVVVPWKMRLPLPWMTWLIFAVLIISGLCVIHWGAMPTRVLWYVKLAVFAIIIVMQIVLTRRPTPVLIRANMLFVLVLMVVSALMIRA